MPSFTFKCPKCSYKESSILQSSEAADMMIRFCSVCKDVQMYRIITNIPNVVVESSWNAKDLGTVLKEKNESLKQKNTAYSDEHQSLMDKTNKKVEQLLKKTN